MESFTPFSSIVGGILIGISASLLLWSLGQVAGISGILGVIFRDGVHSKNTWRIAFLWGLSVVGFVAYYVQPSFYDSQPVRSDFMTAGAGLLVGIGTRLGNGCTSGHGICGLSRLSLRSFIGVLTFMTTGFITVFILNTFLV